MGETRKDTLQCIFDAFGLQIFGVRSKKSYIYFLHNGIHNQSKFCFQKCIWIFFCGICILETSATMLWKYCYRELLKSNNWLSLVDVNNTVLTCNSDTKIVKCHKLTHNFWEICNRHKILQNCVDILLTIPTKWNCLFRCLQINSWPPMQRGTRTMWD